MMRYIAMLLLCLGLTSCYEPPRQGFTEEELNMIDSLYLKHMEGANDRADSLCEVYRNQHFETLADSIKAEYLDEIKNIMK